MTKVSRACSDDNMTGVGVLSPTPQQCRNKHEDWTFLKRYTELEREFRLWRCLAKYCKYEFKKKPAAILACFGRYSLPLYMEYFKENIFK
ncbi:hypothetical protein ScPMuIL_015091 [Solemya velum]